MWITFLLTLPLIAIAAPPFHLEEVGFENKTLRETRMRRAVFDLIPATGDRRRENGRLCTCKKGGKCEATIQNFDPGKHGGTFASYRKFVGRHSSKSRRRSRRRLKKLFLEWLKEEREKVLKGERRNVVKEEHKMH